MSEWIGRWAVNHEGRLGKIERKDSFEDGTHGGPPLWLGTGLDGKPWRSNYPKMVCAKDARALDNR